MRAPANAGRCGSRPQYKAPAADVAELKAEIEALKGMLPSQSHSMVDVEFQFANLWFAGKAQNWPLATFYLNETRSHLNWTVRLRPVRKLSNGGDLDLRPLPILRRKAKKGEIRDANVCRSAHAFFCAFDAPAMALCPREPPLRGPAAIPIHDYGNMFRAGTLFHKRNGVFLYSHGLSTYCINSQPPLSSAPAGPK